MKQEVTNFSRFYSTFNRMPYHGDRETLKQQLVMQFTNGRTESLREVSVKEYEALCNELEKQVPPKPRDVFARELKRRRSEVLHQMQLYGVDTSDWKIVDKFCLDSRIAGKRFRYLEIEDLEALYKKLRAMRKKQDEK